MSGLDPAIVARLFSARSCRRMKQRVCIAIGTCLAPDLHFIADDPTSALDVITQRHVLQTLREAQAPHRRRAYPDRARTWDCWRTSVDEVAVLKKANWWEFGPVPHDHRNAAAPPTRRTSSRRFRRSEGPEASSTPAPAVPSGEKGRSRMPRRCSSFRGVSNRYGAVDALHRMSFRLERGHAADHRHRRPVRIGQVHLGVR